MRFVVVVLRDDGSESLGNANGTTFRGDSESGMADGSVDCGDQTGGRESVGDEGMRPRGKRAKGRGRYVREKGAHGALYKVDVECKQRPDLSTLCST